MGGSVSITEKEAKAEVWLCIIELENNAAAMIIAAMNTAAEPYLKVHLPDVFFLL